MTPQMVPIQEGRFDMGYTLNVEHPLLHSVYVSGFLCESLLVSFSAWKSVLAWASANGYAISGGVGKADDHPVHSVSWNNAVKWCNARSEMAGLTPCYLANGQTYKAGTIDAITFNTSANGFRLPTEAEWEKMARGGKAGLRFANANTISEAEANYYGQTYFPYDLGPSGYNATYKVGVPPYTSPGGAFPPNGFGIYDVCGNIDEWCWDWYATAYITTPDKDPSGPTTGTERVIRGGSWASYAGDLCVGNRASNNPHGAMPGFRCVQNSIGGPAGGAPPGTTAPPPATGTTPPATPPTTPPPTPPTTPIAPAPPAPILPGASAPGLPGVILPDSGTILGLVDAGTIFQQGTNWIDTPDGKKFTYTLYIQIPVPFLNLNITRLLGAFVSPILSQLHVPQADAWLIGHIDML